MDVHASRGERTIITIEQANRADIVLQWVRDGLTSCSDIAKDIGVSAGTVSKIATRLIKEGKLEKTKTRGYRTKPQIKTFYVLIRLMRTRMETARNRWKRQVGGNFDPFLVIQPPFHFHVLRGMHSPCFHPVSMLVSIAVSSFGTYISGKH